MDLDSKYTAQLRRILRGVGISSPNLNAYAERFVQTIKEECLDRLICFGQGMLRRAVDDFVEHYSYRAQSPGLGNKVIAPDRDVGRREGEIVCLAVPIGPLRKLHGFRIRWKVGSLPIRTEVGPAK